MSKLSRTARFYRKNKKAREKRNEYQKKYNKNQSKLKEEYLLIKKTESSGLTAIMMARMFLIKEKELY